MSLQNIDDGRLFSLRLPLYRLTSAPSVLLAGVILYVCSKIALYILINSLSPQFAIWLILLLLAIGAILVHEWAHVFTFHICGGQGRATIVRLSFPIASTPLPGLARLPIWKQRIVIASGWAVDMMILGWGVSTFRHNTLGIAPMVVGLMLVILNGFLPRSDGHRLIATF